MGRKILADLHCTECDKTWKARIKLGHSRSRVCTDCQEEINGNAD